MLHIVLTLVFNFMQTGVLMLMPAQCDLRCLGLSAKLPVVQYLVLLIALDTEGHDVFLILQLGLGACRPDTICR